MEKWKGNVGIKNTVVEMKNAFDGLIRLKMSPKRISDPG